MYREHNLFFKVLHCVVAIAFLATNSVMGAPRNIWEARRGDASAVALHDPAGLVIPEVFGTLQESYVSPVDGLKDKWVLEIQDSHCQYEAQGNIRNILDFLAARGSAAQLDAVAMEGAKGVVDVGAMRAVSNDDKAKAAVSDRFMKAGYFTGVETFAINSKSEPPRVWGLEDRDLYYANLEAYRKAVAEEDRSRGTWVAVKAGLDAAKQSLFAGEALEFLNQCEAFALDKISLTQYVRYLQPTLRKHELDWAQYAQLQRVGESIALDKQVDHTKIAAETQALVSVLQKKSEKEEFAGLIKKSLLYRTGKAKASDFYGHLEKLAKQKGIAWNDYPNLKIYCRIVAVNAELSVDGALADIERVDSALGDKLFTTSAQKDLSGQLRYWRMAKNLMELKCSRRDLAKFKEHRAEIENVIARSAATKQSASPLPLDLSHAERFYDLALQRDQILINNALKIFADPKVKTMAMVTGGFHCAGIKELIKQKGYSYAVILPRITKADDGSLYRAIMLDEQHAFEKLLRRQGNRLSPVVRSPNDLLMPGSGEAVVEDFSNAVAEEANFEKSAALAQPAMSEKGHVPSTAAAAMPGPPILQAKAEMFLKGELVTADWLPANKERLGLNGQAVELVLSMLKEYAAAGLTLRLNLDVGDQAFFPMTAGPEESPLEREAYALLEKNRRGEITGVVMPLGLFRGADALVELEETLWHELDEKRATDYLRRKFLGRNGRKLLAEVPGEIIETWIRRVAHNIARLKGKGNRLLSPSTQKWLERATIPALHQIVEGEKRAVEEANSNLLFDYLTPLDLSEAGMGYVSGARDGQALRRVIAQQAKLLTLNARDILAKRGMYPVVDRTDGRVETRYLNAGIDVNVDVSRPDSMESISAKAVHLFEYLKQENPALVDLLAQGVIPQEGTMPAVNGKDPLIAQELLYQLLHHIGADVRVEVDATDGGMQISLDADTKSIPVQGLADALNAAFPSVKDKIRLSEMAEYFRDHPPFWQYEVNIEGPSAMKRTPYDQIGGGKRVRDGLRERAESLEFGRWDQRRFEDLREEVAKLVMEVGRWEDLPVAQQEAISDVKFLELFAQTFAHLQEAGQSEGAKVMLRMDTGILENVMGKMPEDDRADVIEVYLRLMRKLADAGMVVSLEDYTGEMAHAKEPWRQKLSAELALLASNPDLDISFVSRHHAKPQEMKAAAIAQLQSSKNHRVIIPAGAIGHFFVETLRVLQDAGVSERELAAFTMLLVQTDGGVIELNAVNRRIADGLGHSTLDGKLKVLPEIIADRKFFDTLQQALKKAAQHA